MVRYVDDELTVQPLNLTFFIRGDLELKIYGRTHLRSLLDNGNCYSMLYQLFINGFSVYCNMYRSLMGIYLILASLCVYDRAKSSNILPVTLGPYASNFTDVIFTL